MKRTFWVRGQRRFYGFCWLGILFVTFPLINFSAFVVPGFTPLDLALVDLLFLCMITSILLEVFILRVEVDDSGIRSYNMLNRSKGPLPFDQITAYFRTTTGDWVLAEGDAIYRIPRIDKQEFHAVMAEKAPRALRAKLWKCGQLPPARDFFDLSPFDANLWLMSFMGGLTVSLFVGIFSRVFALFYCASSFLQIAYDLKNIVGRLAITSEGVSVSWPWTHRTIPWSEVTAVFCEREVNRFTYFVVTAKGRSVTIPSHVLIDPEVRRKFLYSIPDHTPCVNFDEMRFRNRGRGKKLFAGEESPSYGSLEPQLMG